MMALGWLVVLWMVSIVLGLPWWFGGTSVLIGVWSVATTRVTWVAEASAYVLFVVLGFLPLAIVLGAIWVVTHWLR